MLQFDKALALKFSPQILKIKMNVLIKLHLYSHTEYKNSDNKICDKALTQNLKKKAFLLNLIIYIENASSEVSCKRPPSPPPLPPLSRLPDANYKNPRPDQIFTFRTTSVLSLRQFLT